MQLPTHHTFPAGLWALALFAPVDCERLSQAAIAEEVVMVSGSSDTAGNFENSALAAHRCQAYEELHWLRRRLRVLRPKSGL